MIVILCDLKYVFSSIDFLFCFYIWSAELERYGDYFVNLVVNLLSSYKVINNPNLRFLFNFFNINLFISFFSSSHHWLTPMLGKFGFICYSNKNTCGEFKIKSRVCIVFSLSELLFVSNRCLQRLIFIRLEIPVDVDNDGSKVENPRKKLEEEYLDIESKVTYIYNVCFYLLM